MRSAYKAVWGVLCLLFLAVPAVSSAESYDGSQFLLSWSESPSHSQTITWHSPSRREGYVQYNKSGGELSGQHQVKAEITDVGETGYYRYEAVLKGLSHNTTYDYRVGNGAEWSQIRTFTTAPDPETWEEKSETSFDFLYLGDVQYRNRNRDYGEWGKLLQDIRERNPGIAFALIGGDMVNSSRKMKDWNLFLDNASPVFSYIPMMPAIGNHETSVKADPYLQMLALPENGPQDLEEEFYSFDYGNCHIIVLNTCFFLDNRKASMAEEWDEKLHEIRIWMEEDLRKSNAKWKLAVLHHPPYGISNGDSVYEWIRQEWEPILEKGEIDLALCGHQHIYMRTKEIGGITYVIGNSGKRRSTYYNGENAPAYTKALDAVNSNYQIIRVEKDRLSLLSYDEKGQIIDRWSKEKHEKGILKGAIAGLIFAPVMIAGIAAAVRRKKRP